MPKATATLAGTVVASTDDYEVVEGNIYFPPSSIKSEYFAPTDSSTYCPWKGHASYYTLKVDGKEYKDAAWYYHEPFDKVTALKDYVAFYKTKVDIESEDKHPKNTVSR